MVGVFATVILTTGVLSVVVLTGSLTVVVSTNSTSLTLSSVSSVSFSLSSKATSHLEIEEWYDHTCQFIGYIFFL